MTRLKLRERKFGLLWFGERVQDRWNITDPRSESLSTACRRLRPGSCYVDGVYVEPSPEEKQRRTDIYTVLRAVEDYQHLTTYELGIEHVIKKLRAIWRAVRGGSDGRV